MHSYSNSKYFVVEGHGSPNWPASAFTKQNCLFWHWYWTSFIASAEQLVSQKSPCLQTLRSFLPKKAYLMSRICPGEQETKLLLNSHICPEIIFINRYFIFNEIRESSKNNYFKNFRTLSGKKSSRDSVCTWILRSEPAISTA